LHPSTTAIRGRCCAAGAGISFANDQRVFNQLSFCVVALALIAHGSGCTADDDIATLESSETFLIRQVAFC
jgi:hypothetical protein